MNLTWRHRHQNPAKPHMVQMNVSRKLRFALQKELELIQNLYTPLKWHMHSGIFTVDGTHIQLLCYITSCNLCLLRVAKGLFFLFFRAAVSRCARPFQLFHSGTVP